MREWKSWSGEELDIIRTRWKAGDTADAIAGLLGNGRTRCAVLGKVHRMKLPPRFERKAIMPKRKKAAKPPVIARKAMPAPAPEKPDVIMRLIDLKPGQCKWPYGDPKETGFGFCGGDCREGAVYCDGHRGKAYQPMYRKPKDYESQVYKMWGSR